MTFKALILNTAWPSISSKFSEIYPEGKKNMKGYELVFEKLKTLEPVKTDTWLVIESVTHGYNNYVDVAGLCKYPKTEEEKYAQGIEFTPWAEWLGMEISKEGLAAYSTQEIIVHCLYEMTYVGFSEEDIQKALNRPKKNREDRKPMTEEEQDKIRTSIEDFLNEGEEED
ncbi:DUF6557 family protein [Arenibacter lacus]|uniref:DUF6557 family protein n=1 Tax=Arenibacter lacus TaxID=2608629 RepID=UPI00123D3F16|nr:DUF6557 family protein [Arenibacter lacus]